MAPEAPSRRLPLGRRGVVVLSLALAGVLAYAALGAAPTDLVPKAGGLELAGRFLAGALAPDLSGETLLEAVTAAWTTVLFAAAAMGLALLLGMGLGFLASTAWWAGDPAGGRGPVQKALRRTLLPLLYGTTRVVIAFMRSIHELLWAVIFGAALGLNNVAAVIAIVIPYAGTLAKVFSEMADEAPRQTAHALRGVGASPLQVFAFGILPRALPDMGAYAFYRFECALRSSAILGFFGYLTLGYYLEPAFQAGRYGTVWTYLYVTFLLVAAVDAWSGRLRVKGVR